MDNTIMWKYIEEIPERVNDLLESGQINSFLEDFNVIDLKQIIFIGSGSSYNAACVAKSLFEKHAKISVELYTPYNLLSSTFDHYSSDNSLVIGISQTGTSSGVIEGINHMKALGYNVLTITERRDTPIQHLGDYYLNFLSELEDCNAKTKGYINSLVLLQIFAMQLAIRKGEITDYIYQDFIVELENSVKEIPETIQKTKEWLEQNKDWATSHHLLVIGAGMNYGTANEGMLKILETLCIPASISELGEFPHGVHRTIDSSSNVILIQTEEYGKDISEKTSLYLKTKIKRLLVIDATNGDSKNDKNNSISISFQKYTASCINISIIFQVIAAYLPEVIGFDPNRECNEDYVSLVKTRAINY